MIDLKCPACLAGRVVVTGAEWRCQGCSRGYSEVRGVIDMRRDGPDEADERKTRELLQVYDLMGFAELVAFSYASDGLRPALYELVVNLEATNRERGDDRLFQTQVSPF